MKNKIAAVVLAASMFGTAVMPAAMYSLQKLQKQRRQQLKQPKRQLMKLLMRQQKKLTQKLKQKKILMLPKKRQKSRQKISS